MDLITIWSGKVREFHGEFQFSYTINSVSAYNTITLEHLHKHLQVIHTMTKRYERQHKSSTVQIRTSTEMLLTKFKSIELILVNNFALIAFWLISSFTNSSCKLPSEKFAERFECFNMMSDNGIADVLASICIV